MSNTQIVKGSISDVATQTKKSFAMTFMDVEIVVIVDTSGSMSERDFVGAKSRYEKACEELAKLQGNNPGKVLVISFSSDAEVCLNGIPTFLMGTTNLEHALKFARQYDLEGMTFFVISDGEPDSERAALEVAAQYKSVIHTIYVGAENNQRAREFLNKLANAKGGKSVEAKNALKLADTVQTLLLNG